MSVLAFAFLGPRDRRAVRSPARGHGARPAGLRGLADEGRAASVGTECASASSPACSAGDAAANRRYGAAQHASACRDARRRAGAAGRGAGCRGCWTRRARHAAASAAASSGDAKAGDPDRVSDHAEP